MGRGWLHPQVWQSLRAQHTAHTDVETLFPGTWAPHFDGGVGGLSDLGRWAGSQDTLVTVRLRRSYRTVRLRDVLGRNPSGNVPNSRFENVCFCGHAARVLCARVTSVETARPHPERRCGHAHGGRRRSGQSSASG